MFSLTYLYSHHFPAYILTATVLTIVLTTLGFKLLLKITTVNEHDSLVRQWASFIYKAAKNPFLLVSSLYLVYLSVITLHNYMPQLFGTYFSVTNHSIAYCLHIIEFVAFFWLVLNVLKLGEMKIEIWLITSQKKIASILFPMISNSLKAAVVLLMLNMTIPELGFTGFANELMEKSAKVALIVICTWLVIELINGLEKLILSRYNATSTNDPLSRKINTQVSILKKVILTLISVIAVAATLMVFDSVKNLGTGLLTTAGLISAAGAFASQQSLGRIFAGLQIAFSQTIRIGDTVIIDNELGQVEEITLSYIIIKIWDLRRLILPTDYFTSRGLQNLTRSSTELLGTVFLYVDFTLPIDVVRAKFKELVAASPYWNKKVSNFEVTDIKQSCMELRILVSANDGGILWNLRCEIREQLMKFITENYPQCLARTRSISIKDDNSRESTNLKPDALES
jgi:small-conductance mechanosensitive channel